MTKRFLAILFLPTLAFAQGVGPGPISGGGGGSISSGSAISGCTAYSIVYIDSAGNLACALAPVNGNVSTAGRGIFKVLDTITGASATSNFVNVTGTFPATLSAATYGINLPIATSAGTDNFDMAALKADLTAGYTGNGQAVAGRFVNTVASGGGFTGLDTSGSIAVVGSSTGSAVVKLGAFFEASGGTGSSGGVYATATDYGGIFKLGSSVTIAAGNLAALAADNVAIAGNIFSASDNSAATSTTAATANVTILDGAQTRLGNMGLTAATMTPATVAELRSVTHAYTWSNAQVVALGAALTGDITVATLPAKTQVLDAMVVITGQAAGTTSLTVSCGDAVGGTPFINYVVASSAQVAANTVYGDAVAERGTSIDTEFWYLPSYTATTLVTCHFISTVENLDQVTGSTGRVVLTTRLMP